MGLANTPAPPYYAVVFTSQRTEKEPDSYYAMAEKMVRLASEQPGFLGVESAREDNGLGITVSYWDSLEAIRLWKQNIEHLEAQEKGKTGWYASYFTRISKVERDYSNFFS
ncbi:antibiotic biosynthesis monooxygenase family protein [Aureibacillus halotolerans]|uniref:Heme-degrading monooxygenase HmoA n=1 Tax=Aureibacillus halotolerans TaxID=1508390 RepID=A0A4R6TTA2_9BACI|nr:antibiotic biosynthesis monooxygenase [Aureibacillus halotolerans]TDQ33443.1 heme-degrading monooxygenase HmoA [Aureibacillus halotolerans]